MIAKSAVLRRSKAYQILQDLRRQWATEIAGMEDDERSHNARYDKWKVDLKSAAGIIMEEKLLSNCGKREHPGFPEFRSKLCFVENITAYKEKLTKFSKRLDDVEKYRTENRSSTINEQPSGDDIDYSDDFELMDI